MTREELDRNKAAYRERIKTAQTIAELETIRAEIWPDLAKDAPMDHIRRMAIMDDYNDRYSALLEIEYPYPWSNKAA